MAHELDTGACIFPPAGDAMALGVPADLPKRLKAYQAAVGGYLEALPTSSLAVYDTREGGQDIISLLRNGDVVMYVNEDGARLGLPINGPLSEIFGFRIVGNGLAVKREYA